MSERRLPEALGALLREEESREVAAPELDALLAPLSADEEAAILAALPAPPEPARISESTAPRRSRLRWIAAAAVPLAAAAVMWLVSPQSVPLPAYELEVRSPTSIDVRSGDSSSTVTWALATETTLDVVVRPVEVVTAALRTRVVWWADGRASELSLREEVDSSGARRLRGLVQLPEGEGELRVVVGPADAVARWSPGGEAVPEVRVMRRVGVVRGDRSER